ncbi:unnamed protein product [Citrullus colocynthis]|uniref:Uncharacterized protein n=1 Tax=Citrullus colocynthis TaxID=252529 RepID=A0ABP0YEY2_9ROSI
MLTGEQWKTEIYKQRWLCDAMKFNEPDAATLTVNIGSITTLLTSAATLSPDYLFMPTSFRVLEDDTAEIFGQKSGELKFPKRWRHEIKMQDSQKLECKDLENRIDHNDDAMLAFKNLHSMICFVELVMVIEILN